jgi:PAS domain S-box-containing protein
MTEQAQKAWPVLIVDDDPISLKVLFTALEDAGFDVRIATNAESAWESIQQSPPDLVLLDVLLPETDGFDISRHLQSDPQARDIPIIFLTALTGSEDKVKGLKLGGVDYITKPFVAAEVVVRVQRHLTIHHLRRQLEEQNEHLQQANEALSREITERKRAEAALRESENRFATVMNSIEAVMYVADLETYEILFINQYTRNIFGDIEGQICWQTLQTEQTGPCDFCTNAHLVANGEPTGLYTWEFQNTRTGCWYHIQDQAIRWIDGRLVRLEVATDVTEHKQAEAKLRAQQRRMAMLEERERIGHELHDELGQVMSYISLQTQTARTLIGQGERAQVETLLTRLVQAAQNAHADLRRYILGIRDAASTPEFFVAMENYLDVLRERYGLDVQMHISDDVTDTPLEAQVEWQLLRIIQEAVANVGKHAGVDTAQLTFQPQDEWMLVTIQDAGRGFVPHAPREQERFGLEMMRERAASIGGSLEIHSDLERGTRVTIRVPLRPLFPQAEGDWAETRGLRVLLVDDHPLFLEGLSTMLNARGVQVVGTARDGLEAQELALELRPDVVLMDVQMPRCDGVKATRQILAQLPDVKIVMLTVAADDDTLFAALKAGASGYMLKGLDIAALFNMLAELMREQVVLAPGLAARVLAEFAGDPSPDPPALSEKKDVGAADDVPPAADSSQPLTLRQIEVLRLIAQGVTYKEVGAALYISERTVKYHMAQILKRLQLKSRAQAIAYAMQEGLSNE